MGVGDGSVWDRGARVGGGFGGACYNPQLWQEVGALGWGVIPCPHIVEAARTLSGCGGTPESLIPIAPAGLWLQGAPQPPHLSLCGVHMGRWGHP